MDIDKLRELYRDGSLNTLFKAGLVSVKPFMMLHFYDYCQANTHKKKIDVVQELSITFKCSERLVYKYLSEVKR